MIALIQAGGFGTRLKSVTGDLPKPLVPVCGRPALFRLVDWLLGSNHIEHVIVLAGYRGEQVRASLDREFHGKVQTIIETTPLGSGGCLRLAAPFVSGKQVLLVSGDLFVDLDLDQLIKHHNSLDVDVTLTVHGNTHPLDADLVEPDEDGLYVKRLLVRPHAEDLTAFNMVNAAITVLESNFFRTIPTEGMLTFEKDLLIPFLQSKSGKISLYQTLEYIQDLGTPERLRSAEMWISVRDTKPIAEKVAVVDTRFATEYYLQNGSQCLARLESLARTHLLTFASARADAETELLKRIEMALGRRQVKVAWRNIFEGETFQMTKTRLVEALGHSSSRASVVEVSELDTLNKLSSLASDPGGCI